MARRRPTDKSKTHKEVSKGRGRHSKWLEISSTVERSIYFDKKAGNVVVCYYFPPTIQSAFEGVANWVENIPTEHIKLEVEGEGLWTRPGSSGISIPPRKNDSRNARINRKKRK